MLSSLTISDLVLIERLELSFGHGLSVLTGETGAGKSILLDALALVLGGRADTSKVRVGADKLSVTAVFDLDRDSPALSFCEENDLDLEEDSLIVRRTVTADGRSKAFLNDQPVSVSFLKGLGVHLVEFHGQFETQGLLSPAQHGKLLDTALVRRGNGADLNACSNTYTEWRAAHQALSDASARLADLQAQEEELKAHVESLQVLEPEQGLEDRLDQQRKRLMGGEKLLQVLEETRQSLTHPGDVGTQLGQALARLDTAKDLDPDSFKPVIEGLDRASIEVQEALSALDQLSQDIDLDPAEAARTEERLFALRAEARKHKVSVDDLPALLSQLESDLDAISLGEEGVTKLAQVEQKASNTYQTAARKLTQVRSEAAASIAEAVMAELAPLKLDKARFQILVEPLSEDKWSATGMDQITFQIATNPGAPAGPLTKIASGGELARFMLALKVVLHAGDQQPSMVFDEVDAGIGGATASAVGERLARLAQEGQVLVVTHSPQVAAAGSAHWQVAKSSDAASTTTSVTPLDGDARTEEIARMLAGAEVTEAARAAAESLLAGGPA